MSITPANNRADLLAASLIGLAILSAMFFNGPNIYMLSLSWGAMVIGSVYQASLIRVVSFTINPVIIILFLFVVWMMVSLCWHPVVWQGANFNSRFGLFVAAAISAYAFASVVSMRAFIVTFLVIMIVVSAFSAYQSVFIGEQASGFLLNKNNNAALHLLIILPLMSALLFGVRSVRIKWLIRLSFAIVLFGYFNAFSRGAHVGLLFAGGGLLYLAIKDNRYSNVISVMTLFCVVLGIYMVLPTGFTPKMNMDSAGRWGIWAATISMLTNTEWYGAGNGMFVLLFPDYWPKELGGILGNFAHNDYLQILFELGIPGLMLLVALYAALCKQVVSHISHRNTDNSYAWYLGMYAAISAVAIHSIFTFNFYITSILIVMGFYTGYLLHGMERLHGKLNGVKRIDIPVSYVFAVLLSFVIAGKWIFFSGIANAMATGVLGDNIYDMTPQQGNVRYQQLARLDPSNYQYPMRAAISLANMGKESSTKRRKDIFVRAMALMEKSISINPYASEPYFAKAGMIRDYQDVVGNDWYHEVTTILSRTIAREPHRLPRGRIQLAKIYENNGDIRQALSVMLEGLSYSSFLNDFDALEYGKMIAVKAKSKYGENTFEYWMERYKHRNTVLPISGSTNVLH